MEYIDYVYGVAILLVGLVAGYIIRQALVSKRAASIEERIKKQIEDAKTKAKETILEAQEKSAAILEEIKREERERKTQLDKTEERLVRKEENIEKQEQSVREKEERIHSDLTKIETLKKEIGEIRQKAIDELENVAGMKIDDAKEILLKDAQKKFHEDLLEYTKKMVHERQEEIEKKTIEIMSTVLQRYSRSSASELTTTTVDIPNEDFKGKIIGKEGRNIRALERATGVELVVDETPDSIVISSFDPVRRQIAKTALEKLIKDGRIQPAKIEEKVEEAKTEVQKIMVDAAETAAYEVGIYDFPKEILQLLGRLHFRTSYGQNVLQHSVEVTHFAGMIASELGLDVEVAKRGALLHDIGKAVDHEIEGSHVDIGRKILKKYNINEEVVHAMEAHHDEYPYATAEAYVVASADALSAARPGARRDSIENYLKRLQDLENIATQFDSVSSAYAISAGRELRVFVTPEAIDDFGAIHLARDIAKRIESDLKYPGEIKVIVIREMRSVEYAA